MLEREAKRLGYSLGQLTKPDYLDPIFRRYTLHSLDDIFVTVGFGGLSSAQIINRLVDPTEGSVRFKGLELSHIAGRELREARLGAQMDAKKAKRQDKGRARGR